MRIVGDGNGPTTQSLCQQTRTDCALGGGHGDARLAYAGIAAVLLAPFVLKLLYPHAWRER